MTWWRRWLWLVALAASLRLLLGVAAGVVNVFSAAPVTSERQAAAQTRAAPAAPAPTAPDKPSGSGGATATLEVPSLLRVGLVTDAPSITLPCCDQQLVAESGGRIVATVSSLHVTPAAEVLSPGVFRLQAAALKDETQAERLAAQLEGSMGEPADVVFDAASDLYRVRVGQYSTREEAEAARNRLAHVGLDGAWVVSERGRLGRAELKVTQGGETFTVPGRWLALRSYSGVGIRIKEGRFRGKILIHLNDRGLLNIINELSVEEYLRGVVPREMGPEVYSQLEALKAQTVAARTYTLKNLGEFKQEGYDICATPRCQVYGGIGVEHPLTDRAIEETAGEVLVYRGQLAEALYSSTCGGHTEDVQVIFPLKDEPYLRGVACMEAGVDRLAGRLARGVTFPDGVTQQLLPPAGPGFTADIVGARLEHLALLAGLPIPRDRLMSLERREVQRFIASIFDLALDARLFVAPEDLPYLIDQPPAGWNERDLRLAAYLVKSGLLAGDLDEPLTAEEMEEVLFRLALYLRVVERFEGHYMGHEQEVLRVRLEDEEVNYLIGERFATYRQVGHRRVSAPLALLAGDRIELYRQNDRLLAVSHAADVDGVAFDRTSNFSSWTRFRSDAQLADFVNERYPGLGFQGLEILSRGVSGRVGKIRILGEAGKSTQIEGLAVRWTLDVPDTLFTAKRLTPPGRPAGWLFTGRGWGHGVGMCQVGAYGMATRGHTYRDILHHYYSGVEIVKVAVGRSFGEATSP